MAAHATIAILRTDADAELANLLRRILDDLPKDQLGQLRINELRCGRTAPCPEISQRAQADLTILIEPEEAPHLARAVAVGLRNADRRSPLLVVLPEILAPEAPQLLKSGVSDFILPPIRPPDLLSRVLHLLRPNESDEALIGHLRQVAGTKQIIGRSPVLMAQLRKLPRFAGCDATVLITGETGTGKELCARAVHYCSRRFDKPLVSVDCGAIPADLIENELFGHERGAYTTALTAQQGLLQESAGGSLFLDEIDSLPLPVQSKLLRFLQEKEYRPLGSPRPRRADVRVIAASNQLLEAAVRANHFRQDLYYRLNVLSLQMPPLRDRREDIPLLAQHFLEKYAIDFSRPARDLTAEAVQKLLDYPWPGNARELENIIERAVLVCEAPLIEARDLELPAGKSDQRGTSYQARKDVMVAAWEFEELKRMLSANGGNVAAAAREEGKDPSAIRALLRKHHLRPLQESPYWSLTIKQRVASDPRGV